jgi:hypothetical protein
MMRRIDMGEGGDSDLAEEFDDEFWAVSSSLNSPSKRLFSECLVLTAFPFSSRGVGGGSSEGPSRFGLEDLVRRLALMEE